MIIKDWFVKDTSIIIDLENVKMDLDKKKNVFKRFKILIRRKYQRFEARAETLILYKIGLNVKDWSVKDTSIHYWFTKRENVLIDLGQ